MNTLRRRFHKNTARARLGVLGCAGCLVFRVFRVDDIVEGQKGDKEAAQNKAKIQYGVEPDIITSYAVCGNASFL